MSEITLEKLDAVIGKDRDESSRRCDDTRLNELREDDTPLTRIWLRDLPMKRIEAAAELFTNPGCNSGLTTYS
jgi:hypothetical protein